jgi:preprotein translocase subunit SecG
MIIVVLVIHVMLTVTLIGVVLVQKSEGGGLGIGGGGGMSGFMTGRSTANLLTRTTAFLAAGFMLTSITLAVLYGRQHIAGASILDQMQTPAAPITAPAPVAPAEPAAPAQPPAPSVPLAK